ncbi:13421_t:CDS:1 [Cetraspora pellucida]|uniref:13421_t:CDS:1 n=1 Tax=Cetraspora pellucida TaxID=1433469 RepID=A0ACA9K2L0_9GLOM|nr:13421_t:CDS:1 [Cetraspora pellucida]
MVPSLALNIILISSSILLTTFLLQTKRGHLRSKCEKSWILTTTVTSVVSLSTIPFLYQALRSKWEWIEKFIPKENVLSIMILWIFLTEVITLVFVTPSSQTLVVTTSESTTNSEISSLKHSKFQNFCVTTITYLAARILFHSLLVYFYCHYLLGLNNYTDPGLLGNKNTSTTKSNSQRERDYSTVSLFSVIYALQCWWSRQFIKQQLSLRNQFKKSKVLQNILYSQDELKQVLDDLQQGSVKKNVRIIEPRNDDGSYTIRKRFNKRQRMLQLKPSVPTIFEEDESEVRFEYESNEITNSEYGYLTTIIEEDEDESGDSGYNSSNEKTSDPCDEQFFNIDGLGYSSIKQSPQFLMTF